jgi:hypothetical protein
MNNKIHRSFFIHLLALLQMVMDSLFSHLLCNLSHMHYPYLMFVFYVRSIFIHSAYTLIDNNFHNFLRLCKNYPQMSIYYRYFYFPSNKLIINKIINLHNWKINI